MKKYNGCSGGMSKTWRFFLRRNPPWEGCCNVHDQPYAKGGTVQDRMDADIALMCCVAKSGHPYCAFAMFVGVRIGGIPWLHTPWRWGSDTKKLGYTK